MSNWIDPNWFTSGLGMPFSQLVLFPISTLLLFYIIGKIRASADATLVSQQKPKFIVSKFLFGFIFGGLFIVLTVAFCEKKFATSISPLPELLGIDDFI